MHGHSPTPPAHVQAALEELRKHTWYEGTQGRAYARIPARTNLIIDETSPVEGALAALGIPAHASSGRHNTLLIEADATRLSARGIAISKNPALPSSHSSPGGPAR
jgi:hypothetical protein